jgi:hypothetical protein
VHLIFGWVEVSVVTATKECRGTATGEPGGSSEQSLGSGRHKVDADHDESAGEGLW